MKRVNDLGNDKMFPLVLRLVIPSMLAQLVNVLYSIVDRIFISRMANGELALAGVGVCGPIVTLITSFSFLLGLGGAPLLAMKLGEGDKSTGEKILFNCFFALIVVAVLLAAFFWYSKKLCCMCSAQAPIQSGMLTTTLPFIFWAVFLPC